MNKEQNLEKLQSYAAMVAEQTKQEKYKLKLEKSIASHSYKLEKLRTKDYILKCLATASVLLSFALCGATFLSLAIRVATH